MQQREQWSAFRRPFGEDALGFYLEEGPGLKAPPSPCGGYLGTGQSGKHLIATLRRGDVRNKGGCAESWELPFPGNSGSLTKP